MLRRSFPVISFLQVCAKAANGMMVWVPKDKLEKWQKAQEDQSPEAKKRRKELCSRILERMEQLAAQRK